MEILESGVLVESKGFVTAAKNDISLYKNSIWPSGGMADAGDLKSPAR